MVVLLAPLLFQSVKTNQYIASGQSTFNTSLSLEANSRKPITSKKETIIWSNIMKQKKSIVGDVRRFGDGLRSWRKPIISNFRASVCVFFAYLKSRSSDLLHTRRVLCWRLHGVPCRSWCRLDTRVIRSASICNTFADSARCRGWGGGGGGRSFKTLLDFAVHFGRGKC